jgi:hypothetical protein
MNAAVRQEFLSHEFGLIVWYRKASERYLTDEKQSGKDEKRILDVLSKGLSTEFPNPGRLGCPGSATLEGIASHRILLAEAEKWLDHLGSCSPCFQEFTAIRQKLRARRRIRWGGGLAILFGALALWLVLHSHQAANETATLDLRGYSVERGQQNPSNPLPLQITRSTRHLILYLPIASKEGGYEIALLSDTGSELVHTSGVAVIQDHAVILRTDVSFAGVPPGPYSLGLRQSGLAWTRFPVRVF